MIAVFLFYDQGMGKHSRFSFSREFIHCALLCYQGDHCVLFEIAPHGFHYRLLNSRDMVKNLEAIKKMSCLSAYIAVFVKEKTKVGEWPFKGYTCNEVCRYFSGVAIGWTLNPKHLFKKLMKFKETRNYELLAHWRRA
jgi:hypothetical protein